MPDTDLDAVSRALEQLLRLNASRKVHANQAAAAGVSLSPPGMALLRRLQEEGPLSMGELARLTHMDPAATGRQVRQLEQDGLVMKDTSPADRRVTVVRLTPRGADVRRRVSAVLDHHLEDVLGGWSKTDRAKLGTLLTRLVEDLRTVRYRPAEGDEIEEAAAG